MSVLKHLDPHPHVICLYGCVTTEGEIHRVGVNITTLLLFILLFSSVIPFMLPSFCSSTFWPDKLEGLSLY